MQHWPRVALGNIRHYLRMSPTVTTFTCWAADQDIRGTRVWGLGLDRAEELSADVMITLTRPFRFVVVRSSGTRRYGEKGLVCLGRLMAKKSH